jgi:hypothetical protein
MSDGPSTDISDDLFYNENGGWPFVHSIVPTALIALVLFPSEFALFTLAVALLFIFLWEVFEKVTQFFGSQKFAENSYDSLIGDPLMGATYITAFWVFDQITHWERSVERIVPWWLRLIAFVVIALPYTWMSKFNSSTENHAFRYSVWVYGAYYILIAALLYYIAAAVADDDRHEDAENVVKRTSVWIALVFLITIVASIVEKKCSTWLQCFAFGLSWLLLITFLSSIKYVQRL